MTMHTNKEPIPRLNPKSWSEPKIECSGFVKLPAQCQSLDIPFLKAMDRRSSGVGGTVGDADLANLLWHASHCYPASERGRFDRSWYHSFAPAAAGLHSLKILCIPIQDQPIGIYDRIGHKLNLLPNSEEARQANAANVVKLTKAKFGSTLQFFADPEELATCYENSASLLWRDSGALATAISFVAAALGLTSVILGRVGTNIIRSAGLDIPHIGVGAVHIGTPQTCPIKRPFDDHISIDHHKLGLNT